VWFDHFEYFSGETAGDAHFSYIVSGIDGYAHNKGATLIGILEWQTLYWLSGVG
jgi:hypothetical protein